MLGVPTVIARIQHFARLLAQHFAEPFVFALIANRDLNNLSPYKVLRI
jgi:hypothetical protein